MKEVAPIPSFAQDFDNSLKAFENGAIFCIVKNDLIFAH